ncbi:MAG: hypothetical protein KDA80_01850 [Planctomycetaceae bacterium]|nr:hypothetical protein [Planctomycetaceae bacterium]
MEISEPQYVTEDGSPNVALLQDRMPPHLQASRPVVALATVLGFLFIFLSFRPLWHTDLWGHLSYGRWIWQNGHLPVTEPLMPLSKGVPMIDTAWLSQLLGYGMITQFGPSGIQFLYALAIGIVMSLLTYAVYRRTGNPWAALLTLAVFHWVEYHQLLIVRPQLAGMVCFAAIFTMATSARWRGWYTWTIPVLFAIWANMHGSFLVGLVLLGGVLTGRAIDVYRRTRDRRFVFADRTCRQLLIALELSAAAVLLNPYGLAIYPEVFAVAGSKNLEALVEWDPLTLRMKQGQAAAVIALALIVMYRFTPRRVTMREVLLLCGYGALALWTSRMIVWWGPVAAYYLGLHTAAVWKSWSNRPAKEPVRGGMWTVVLLGLCWIFFAYTPFGSVAIHGRPTDEESQFTELRRKTSSQTPVAIAEYLRKNPPQGQVFNAYEWGDYLTWAGPEGMQVFLNSHAHLVPEEVWQDYLETVHGSSDWSGNLNRYGVNAIILDRMYRGDFIRKLEDTSSVWEKKYADNVGAVFYRKNPI